MTREELSFERVGFASKPLLETLRRRYAASAGCNPDAVIFLPSPEMAKLIGLKEADVEQIGPAESPLAAVRARDNEADLKRWEATLSDGLIDAGLEALSPVSKQQKHMEYNRKQELYKVLLLTLSGWSGVETADAEPGLIRLTLSDAEAVTRRFSSLGLVIPVTGNIAEIPLLTFRETKALTERLAIASGRSATVRRTTKETDIFVSLSLDQSAPVRITTGVEYFDHMLEQIAKHGGFSLEVACEGDTGIDAHHTIEDVALAFGEALAKALGDRRGIGRFGFELPMDETRAGVWIDLSGRPFSKFEGDIPGERVGEFPVEMTSHVFRSIADSLKAAIHVSVEGENAHHMIEACFKAFGRALRQAVKVEGDTIPSTKGVL